MDSTEVLPDHVADRYETALAKLQGLLTSRGLGTKWVTRISLQLFGNGCAGVGLPLRKPPELLVYGSGGRKVAEVTLGARSGAYVVSLVAHAGDAHLIPSDKPELVVGLMPPPAGARMTSKADFEIPYVIGYRGEEVPQRLRMAPNPLGGLRLSHWAPDPEDWQHGVLRARMRDTRTGRPDLATVNVPRQWRCMDQTLCQACAAPARDPETDRVWWLLAAQDTWAKCGSIAGYTNAPPTCLTCIPKAITQCPHLRSSAQVYSVGGYSRFAVIADLFEPRGQTAHLVERGARLRLDSSHLRYALASQLMVRLDDVVPVPWGPLADTPPLAQRGSWLAP
ncbi:hypothetical protein AB0K48_53280 [Nonomuraea sp. NPDC055795]